MGAWAPRTRREAREVKENRMKRASGASQGSSWTHPSVLVLARSADPVEAIAASARKLVYEAAERGWSGPPYDPFVLAELMRFETVPREDVRDARMVPSGAKRSRIEYNPNRPAPRIRYSVAHELGHTPRRSDSQKTGSRGVNRLLRLSPGSESLRASRTAPRAKHPGVARGVAFSELATVRRASAGCARNSRRGAEKQQAPPESPPRGAR